MSPIDVGSDGHCRFWPGVLERPSRFDTGRAPRFHNARDRARGGAAR